MQTIGEKLEEARKHRGISIREASEVTKIRSDYLGSFESNSFDLNIPEVYIRGFLRTYARFLKLNDEKVITDYNAHQLGESSFVRQKESREFLGRMDIPGDGGETPPPAAQAPAQHRQPPPAQGDDSGFNYNNFDKASLIKGGVVMAGAGVLVAVIVLVVLAVLRSGPEITAAEGTTTQPTGTQELTLIANGGDILSITVTEISTGQELFRGPLNQNDRQRVPFNEQVRLSYSNAEYLHIEHDGLRYEIGGRGVSRSSFPRRVSQ